ncbi:magnesium-dependent phosphatase 1-like isoform X2 [Lineus longissimus]
MWPFHVECECPPFRKESDGKVYDSYGSQMKYYPEVPSILEDLEAQGIDMGVASRTEEPRGANQLLQCFGWEKYFKYKEIYPGNKKTHFKRFSEASGLPYKDMLFFDDEMRNIRDINGIGATAFYVHGGMTHAELKAGLKQFENNQKHRS